MIVVFGGMQIDQPNTDPARFPESRVEDVAARVSVLLSSLRPRLVVGAAASGADLVVLEEALAVGLAVRVVLPFSVERFRQTSVKSRGPAWTERYARMIERMRGGAGELEILDEVEDEEVYRRTNGRLLDRAEDLAATEEEVVVLLLRPAGGDSSSVTDDLAARAKVRGWLVLDLDIVRAPADHAIAFMAMPYGRKKDPRTGVEIDCDIVFDRVYVPVLEDLDFRWRRSDRETDTGIIHIGMIEAIANSDVVLSDLVTLNANVLYELGLRHALADKVTVLTAPEEAGGLFDIEFIRRIPYQCGTDGLDDAQVVASIRRLRQALVDATDPARPIDSPVFTWFDTARTALRVREGMIRSAQTEIVLRRRLESVRVRGATEMRALAAEIDAAAIPAQARTAMHLELAITLRERGAYADAVGLFAGAEPPDGALRTLWLQQQVMALRRHGEQQLSSGGDPDPAWTEAQQLLDELLTTGRPSAESWGIAAGLAKRRFERWLFAGNRPLAQGQMTRMINLYRQGFEAEPWDYYVGVNLLAALRLRGQRFPGPTAAAELSEARDMLPVVRLMTRRIPPPGRNFWVEITDAELTLHAYLLNDPQGTRSSEAVVTGYAQVLAGMHPPDYEHAARGQLQIFQAAGDPSSVIDAVLSAFPTQQ